MPCYKLMYFDGRGRAEIARLIFAAADVQYEDIRYSKEAWPEVKAKTPSGQLPCLDIDGKIYSQSFPIAVYLSSEFGFHGNTPEECLQVNMVLGTAGDLGRCMHMAKFESDQEKKDELFEKLKKEDIPKHLDIFETLLKKDDSDYFCLQKLTLADLIVFNVLEMPVKNNPSLLDQYPRVKANMAKVAENPGISKWLENRPKTEF